jgi:hypothetical protein
VFFPSRCLFFLAAFVGDTLCSPPSRVYVFNLGGLCWIDLLTYPLDLTIFLSFFQAGAYPSNLGSWVQHLSAPGFPDTGLFCIPAAWVSSYMTFLRFPGFAAFVCCELFGEKSGTKGGVCPPLSFPGFGWCPGFGSRCMYHHTTTNLQIEVSGVTWFPGFCFASDETSSSSQVPGFWSVEVLA